jgi:D-alanine transaminase
MTQLKFTHRDRLKYSYEERGVQFGDGIYEVIRVYDGKCYLLKDHVDRLFRSAEAIRLELSFSKEEITDNLLELLNRNQMEKDGHIYLQITRGSAPRTHEFPANVEPNLYAYVKNMPRHTELLNHGVETILTRDVRWENCYIKSLNLLPNVLAKQEAKEQGRFEAILHRDGLVTEGSSSNIFLIKDGILYTHPATNRILHGCVRAAVLGFARKQNIKVVEEAFDVKDIQHADEMFMTSSTSEVMPIVKVDDVTIGDGKPGTVTRSLQQAYEKDASIFERRKLVN